MCRISVVVPVYNTAESLPGCTASILKDAPRDLELILVNDGSTDQSDMICLQLAREDDRIKVLSQVNAGASAARNAGLDIATGDYVTFVDADDRLLPGIWAKTLDVLQREKPDLYTFGVEFAVGETELPQPAGRWESPRALPNLPQVIQRQMVEGCTLTGPVAKFYRRELLGSLRFDTSLKINEDFLFNTQFLGRCGPMVFDSLPLYHYENSASGSLSRQLRDDLMDVEEYTRPAFAGMLKLLGLEPEDQQQLISLRQCHCAVAQFGLLAGQKGKLPLERRIELTKKIFALPAARAVLTEQYNTDPNRVLSLPYRLCLWLPAPRLMAIYCAVKNIFL